MKNVTFYVICFIIGIIIGCIPSLFKIEYISFKWWTIILISDILFVQILSYIDSMIKNKKSKSK